MCRGDTEGRDMNSSPGRVGGGVLRVLSGEGNRITLAFWKDSACCSVDRLGKGARLESGRPTGRCSASVFIREIKTKTIVRCHFTHIRI